MATSSSRVLAVVAAVLSSETFSTAEVVDAMDFPKILAFHLSFTSFRRLPILKAKGFSKR
jgi:hypothetical protein